jgi:hypothetical protein
VRVSGNPAPSIRTRPAAAPLVRKLPARSVIPWPTWHPRPRRAAVPRDHPSPDGKAARDIRRCVSHEGDAARGRPPGPQGADRAARTRYGGYRSLDECFGIHIVAWSGITAVFGM